MSYPRFFLSLFCTDVLSTEPERSEAMDSFDWHKGFAVAWISRIDLSDFFSAEALASLSDADMKRIASLMEDLYHDNAYWDDLFLCANRLLREKEEEHGLA